MYLVEINSRNKILPITIIEIGSTNSTPRTTVQQTEQQFYNVCRPTRSLTFVDTKLNTNSCLYDKQLNSQRVKPYSSPEQVISDSEPTPSLFVAQRPSTYSKGNMGNLGETKGGVSELWQRAWLSTIRHSIWHHLFVLLLLLLFFWFFWC